MLPIRSYVRRQGRMVPAQKHAIDTLWDEYGITTEGGVDLQGLFGRQAPRYLEIGFGMGDALLEMARTHPEQDYLGVEVHLPGVGRLLQRLAEMQINNVRIDRRDALEVMDYLPDRSMSGVYLFFPDPWLKKRHNKRRLVQAIFVEKMLRVLASGGFFHAVTDCDAYALHILEVMAGSTGFVNRSASGPFHPRPAERPYTRFEQRSLQRGHEVRDLLFERM